MATIPTLDPEQDQEPMDELSLLLNGDSEESSEEANKERSKKLFEEIINSFRTEEEDNRIKIRREIERGESFWIGKQDIYWNSDSNVWQTAREAFDQNILGTVDLLDYDKYINVYKSHGKSVVAATSVQFPKYTFLPDDYNKAIDLLTSEVYSKAADIVQRQNDGKNLFARAFWIRWNQHFVAIYNYHKYSPDFGQVEKTEEVPGMPQEVQTPTCPNCGSEYPEEGVCGSCGVEYLEPIVKSEMQETVELHSTFEDRGREILEVYGPKHVTIPLGATRIEDCPYLRFSKDFHITQVYSEFNELAKNSDFTRLYDLDGVLRMNTSGGTERNRNYVPVDQDWLRPYAYYMIGITRKADVEFLQTQYPDGVKVISINKKPVLCIAEKLDDHWTIKSSATSDSLHDQPLGKDLLPINEMTNEMVQFSMELVKQAAPELFADPDVLNFKAYGKTERRPGNVTPAIARPGMNLDSGFYEAKSSIMSGELEVFEKRLEQFGQLVVHAFPSLFGGTQQGGSGTYAEYAKSAQQALQVLGLDYTPVADAFGTALKKAVKSFIENMQEDSYSYSYSERGNPVNIFVDRTVATGKIGEVNLESDSKIPLSWAELRAMIVEFIQTGNPALLSTLFHPANTTIMKDVLGLKDFYIPGEADRKKQLNEIDEMLDAVPQMQDQTDPILQAVQGPQQVPSVPVDDSDNHMIHIDTITIWETSEAGIHCKKENPQAHLNIQLHKQMHQMAMQAQQVMEGPPGSGKSGNDPNSGPPAIPPKSGGSPNYGVQ